MVWSESMTWHPNSVPVMRWRDTDASDGVLKVTANELGALLGMSDRRAGAVYRTGSLFRERMGLSKSAQGVYSRPAQWPSGRPTLWNWPLV